jgi:CCR4-Not complex component, Not1
MCIGQYHLLRAMVLHLRYPNAHTHWFSSLMLHLFADTKDERFKEILTRTLLEHVMVHRPHPWGILVTFIELVRNPKYEFWTRDFIRIAPEITLIMENVCSLWLKLFNTNRTFRWRRTFSRRDCIYLYSFPFALRCSFLFLGNLYCITTLCSTSS